VQYGPRAQAAMVHLNQNHAVSIQRTAALMKDFFDLPVSEASVVKATQTGADLLEPSVQDIGQAIAKADVAHADESGLRVAKNLHWLHVLATDKLTWMRCHPKRGGEAFASLALLQLFKGVLVDDGWLSQTGIDAPSKLKQIPKEKMFDKSGQWTPLETFDDFDNGLSDLIDLWSSKTTKKVKESALAHYKEDLEAAVLNWAENRAKSRKYAAIGEELAEFEEALK
jgi:transposase